MRVEYWFFPAGTDVTEWILLQICKSVSKPFLKRSASFGSWEPCQRLSLQIRPTLNIGEDWNGKSSNDNVLSALRWIWCSFFATERKKRCWLGGTRYKVCPNKCQDCPDKCDDHDCPCGFIWSDGTPMNFTNWAPGQPDNDVNLTNIYLPNSSLSLFFKNGNEYCMEINMPNIERGFWNDVPCFFTSLGRYVCKKSNNKTFKQNIQLKVHMRKSHSWWLCDPFFVLNKYICCHLELSFIPPSSAY